MEVLINWLFFFYGQNYLNNWNWKCKLKKTFSVRIIPLKYALLKERRETAIQGDSKPLNSNATVIGTSMLMELFGENWRHFSFSSTNKTQKTMQSYPTLSVWTSLLKQSISNLIMSFFLMQHYYSSNSPWTVPPLPLNCLTVTVTWMSLFCFHFI